MRSSTASSAYFPPPAYVAPPAYFDPVEDGTRAHPFIIKANFQFPERNSGLDIVEVPLIEFEDHTQTAFKLQKVIDPPDFEKWELSIPPSDFLPAEYGLEDSCLLLEGPSQSFWACDTERFYERCVTCAPSKAVHQAAEVAATDVKRRHSYWLIVFPKEVKLDNAIFSGNGNAIVDAEVVVLKHVDFESSTALLGCAIVWRIGLGGVTSTHHQEGSTTSQTHFRPVVQLSDCGA